MRVRLTNRQKSLRRAARLRGLWAVSALNLALRPVYDGDEEIYTRRAVMFARESWRYALQAESESKILV